MDRLRLIAVAFGLVAPAAGSAAPGDITDPVMMFAACAGRLSAEMEHSWLDGRDPTQVTRQRAAMIDLVEATRSSDNGAAVLATRIEAKMAQAALLHRATFNSNPDESARARRLAWSARDQCTGLIPG